MKNDKRRDIVPDVQEFMDIGQRPGRCGSGVLKYARNWRQRALRLLAASAVAAAMLMPSVPAKAQDLENHGTITNRGLMRVKAQAINLPDTIGGGFDYKGSDQTVPARTYRNLILTGSGTKTTSGGSFAVRSNINIAGGVTMKVDTGGLVDLGGVLGGAGYLEGKIRKQEFLSGLTGISSFGNIGAEIGWNGVAPDTTVVTRVSGTARVAQGQSSIKRYYDIKPKVNAGLDATFVFHYDKVELDGQNEHKLVLWSSSDNGVTWDPRGGTIDTMQKTISKSGIASFGLWTASDSLHPLGAFRKAARLMLAAGNSQSGRIFTSIQPFVVTVVSADSVPMPGEKVTFAIVSSPAGARGQMLSDTTVLTDAAGHAAAMLTLGSKVGDYHVAAVANGLAGSPVVFSATASVGAPKLFASVAGANQSDIVTRTLANPFTAVIVDSGGNPIPDLLVDFGITQQPAGSTGASLSSAHALSDSLGRVSTVLTFGTKVGVYAVSVSVANVAPLEFRATASAAAPAIMASVSGNEQQGRVFTTLAQPFVVTVTDSFGNPSNRAMVKFAIASSPLGSTGARLTADSVATDSLGNASTNLRVGSRPGDYLVSATIAGTGNAGVMFRAHGIVGMPATIAMVAGGAQRAAILDTLAQAFVVALLDSAGNPVGGDSVRFAVTSAPSGAMDYGVTLASSLTDSNGAAGTRLVVGDREGNYVVTVTAAGLPGRQLTISGYAFIYRADANNDQAVNIADLTTMIDATMGKVTLTKGNFVRADIDSNRVLNAADEQLLADGLVLGTYDTLGTIRPGFSAKAGIIPEHALLDPALASAELELTKHGVRFNLTNSVGLRGVELVFRLKAAADIAKLERFQRGGFMSMPYRVGSDGLVRIVAYNGGNRQINAGDGTIFRLPVVLEDTLGIEVVAAIAADSLNRAIVIPVSRTRAVEGKYPEQFALLQNYPNPFNMETKIEYSVPDATEKFNNMLLQIFDISGRKIRTLVKGQQEAGHYTATWDGLNDDGVVVASGVYLVRLWTPGQMYTRKMLLTK